jgi:circadian clock protein KaiC
MNGERTRGLYVIKSRGMPHSNQVREFVIGSDGIHLLDVYPGPDGILTGSARVTQDAKRAEGERALVLASKRADSMVEQKKRALEAQIAALQAAFTLESEAIRQEIGDRRELAVREDDQRRAISERRSNGLTARPKKKGR